MAQPTRSEDLCSFPDEARNPASIQQAVDDAERDLAAGSWVEDSDVLAKLYRLAGSNR